MKYLITGVGKGISLGNEIVSQIRKMDKDAYIIGLGLFTTDIVDEYLIFDLTHIDAIHTIIVKLSHHDNIDVLVNCAGDNHMDWAENISYYDYNRVMTINLHAPIFLTTTLVPLLKGGTVLNITSMGARKCFRTSMPYNVSKAGLVMATKQMAREFTRKHNMTVFAVSPNQIKGTGMTSDNLNRICSLRGWTPEEAESYRKAGSMIDEETPCEVIAEFIAHLITDKDRSRYISGVEIQYGE